MYPQANAAHVGVSCLVMKGTATVATAHIQKRPNVSAVTARAQIVPIVAGAVALVLVIGTASACAARMRTQFASAMTADVAVTSPICHTSEDSELEGKCHPAMFPSGGEEIAS